ncbi:hypothetical protein [Bacteroides sp.]|uniref:hypothetical protein n=1 Tax=Bacteroides sp. TaxID=29523 RepID=UPI0025BAA115|nr:hypothetical protein [Bacteroides sp.]
MDKDIDMTITVGGDLTLPGSSTERMLLGDLLELEDDGIVKTNETTGDYALVKDGGSNSTQVKVPGVDITVDENSGFTQFSQTFSAGTSGTIDRNDLTLGQNVISIDITHSNTPEELESLSSATTIMKDTYLELTQNSNATVKLNDGYQIIFPPYMTVKYTGADGLWNVTGQDKNILELNNDEGFEINSNSRINFEIVEIRFENSGSATDKATFDKENKKINLNGKVSFNGTLSAQGEITANGITVSGNIKSQNIVLNTVTGTVNPTVDINVEPIKLEGMPDFFTDNDVTLDLTDPKIFVNVKNPSPVKVEISGSLTSTKTGKEDKTVTIPNFVIPGDTPEGYVICLNQIKSGTNGGINYVKVEELSSIIENIPDEIKMDIDAKAVQENITVELDKEFTVETQYNIDTPLMFGSKTNIKYVKTIDGWGADLDEAEFELIEASMIIENAIPLGLNLVATAIDKDGKPLTNVKVDMNIDVEPGTIENPTKKDVKFSISTEEGNVKGLDGIEMTVTAKAGENTAETALNENQTLKLDDIKLRLKGGVTMDLN